MSEGAAGIPAGTYAAGAPAAPAGVGAPALTAATRLIPAGVGAGYGALQPAMAAGGPASDRPVGATAVVAPPPAKSAANPTGAPTSTSKQDQRFGLARIAITIDSRASCNGSGHAVYLVNETQLSVTATVTTYEDSTQTASRGGKSDNYTVDPASSWRLGCDTTTDGRRVRFELTRWR